MIMLLFVSSITDTWKALKLYFSPHSMYMLVQHLWFKKIFFVCFLSLLFLWLLRLLPCVEAEQKEVTGVGRWQRSTSSPGRHLCVALCCCFFFLNDYLFICLFLFKPSSVRFLPSLNACLCVSVSCAEAVCLHGTLIAFGSSQAAVSQYHLGSSKSRIHTHTHSHSLYFLLERVHKCHHNYHYSVGPVLTLKLVKAAWAAAASASRSS